MSRRVITGAAISELAAQGGSSLQLEASDIVTALARDEAASLGITLVPVAEKMDEPLVAPAVPDSAVTDRSESIDMASSEQARGFAEAGGSQPCLRVENKDCTVLGEDDVVDHDQVRRAVIGVLGYEPDGLDAAIVKALN